MILPAKSLSKLIGGSLTFVSTSLRGLLAKGSQALIFLYRLTRPIKVFLISLHQGYPTNGNYNISDSLTVSDLLNLRPFNFPRKNYGHIIPINFPTDWNMSSSQLTHNVIIRSQSSVINTLFENKR